MLTDHVLPRAECERIARGPLPHPPTPFAWIGLRSPGGPVRWHVGVRPDPSPSDPVGRLFLPAFLASGDNTPTT